MSQNKLFTYLLGLIIFTSALVGCAELPKKENFKVPATLADQSSSIKAQLEIAKDKNLWNNSHISVVSYKNNLLLVGQTPSSSLRERAEMIVSELENTDNVYNQLDISEPIAFSDRAKDTWITTQIKTKLVTNRSVDSHNVRVITESGTVYLFGDLPTAQQQLAAEISSKIKGVKSVVKVFINS
jgi:osmotically-inducible protein OsmY